MKKTKLDEQIDEWEHDAISIEPLALEEEFVRNPSDIARANAKYASALKRWLHAKRHEAKTYSRRYLELRETASSKLTEAMLKHMVEMDEDYQTAVMDRINAEVDKVRLHGVLEALKAKRDSLISIGAHMRAEMGGGPRINRRAQDDEDDDEWGKRD